LKQARTVSGQPAAAGGALVGMMAVVKLSKNESTRRSSSVIPKCRRLERAFRLSEFSSFFS
jgi:hypothetical protein